MASADSTPTPVSDSRRTYPMQVANLSFLLDRLHRDCSPLQFLRELTQNSIEAIQELPDPTGEIIWDVDWISYDLAQPDAATYKLCLVDTGIAMTGREMVRYINALSSSVREQSETGNYGVGAKIAAAPRNKAGLMYQSWKEGGGSIIHLWYDPEAREYGLQRFERPDGTYESWGHLEEAVRPEDVEDHGTKVVLLGNGEGEDTMQAPAGAASPSRWIARYLNTRYFQFPEGITVKAREGWENPRSDTDRNLLRTVTGMRPYLERHAENSGQISLTDATAHWWILREEPALDKNSGILASSGHVAALYQDELYEMATGRSGVARLQHSGVIFGHKRVVIYVEPHGDNGGLTSNTARTHLLLNGDPLPWADWAAEFREGLPSPIRELVEDAARGGEQFSDQKQSIFERLKAIRDLYRLSKYRPNPRGMLELDESAVRTGGRARPSGRQKGRGSSRSGGAGGRAGGVYSLFLTAGGVKGEELNIDPDPDIEWVSVEDGTREPPDLDDRAAKYLEEQNLILANADFRVFVDMIDRWLKAYSHVPGARNVIHEVVHEWFAQQLIETVLGIQSLSGSSEWSIQEMEKVWSEESLTAATMPRYHIDIAIKRALGVKLGSLKERTG